MILGLDISTSCIGYCLFNSEGDQLMELNYVKFNRKLNLFEKMDEFKKNTKHLIGLDIKEISIEEPLKKYEGKLSSSDTIAILNFFNGMISSYLYNTFKIMPVHYNVKIARSEAYGDDYKEERGEGKSNKHQVWSLVNKREPHIVWKYGPKTRELVSEMYDMSDAYTVCLCHINKLKSHNLI